jgi:ATP-dependent DNA ligase
MSEYRPMRAVLAHRPFSDPAGLYERKFDGIRCGMVRRDGRAQLVSRGGETLSSAYPELVDAFTGSDPELIADGEIVAFEGRRTSFARLQGRMQIRDPERARAAASPFTCTCSTCSSWMTATSARCPCASASARCAARSRSAGGCTTPRTASATGRPLADELERRERPDPPFGADGLPRRTRWAEPELVAEIEFTEWTRDGKLRHPRYLGLRHDKPAREVVREEPGA